MNLILEVMKISILSSIFYFSFFLAINKSFLAKTKGWNAARASGVVDNLCLLIYAAGHIQQFFWMSALLYPPVFVSFSSLDILKIKMAFKKSDKYTMMKRRGQSLSSALWKTKAGWRSGKRWGRTERDSGQWHPGGFHWKEKEWALNWKTEKNKERWTIVSI